MFARPLGSEKDLILVHNERIKALADIAKTLSAGSIITFFAGPAIVKLSAGQELGDLGLKNFGIGAGLMIFFGIGNGLLLNRLSRKKEKEENRPTVIVNGIYSDNITVTNPSIVRPINPGR